VLINNYFLTQFLKLNVDVFISELIIGLSIGGGGLLLVVLILLLVIKAWYVSNKYIFIRVISLTTGRMVPGLARAMERLTNLHIIFSLFVKI
jgi:hypothetical protein